MQTGNLTSEQKKQKILAKIKNFCLMDDDFMTRFFDGDLECTEYVLQIILGKSDLKVTKVVGQKVIKNLQERSVRLDVFAHDEKNRPYNVEIQRADKGAGARRARYNSALIDAEESLPWDDTENLPETFVIFITENDMMNLGKPLYHIERTVQESGSLFNDGTHIIYVNGKYRGNDPIGSLMHDFSCTNADEMNSNILANKVRYLKETEKGVQNMCRIMEEFAAEERNEQKIETALEMLKDGTLSLEKISQYSQLPLETVKQLAEQKIAVQA